MTAAEKAAKPKPMVCPKCGTADRTCDVPGCGRECCKHRSKRDASGLDSCGVCNLARARAAKKAAAK